MAAKKKRLMSVRWLNSKSSLRETLGVEIGIEFFGEDEDDESVFADGCRWVVYFNHSPIAAYRRRSDAEAHVRKIKAAMCWDASKRDETERPTRRGA